MLMLSTLEANFVTEYQITGNATQAYKAAGFPIKSDRDIRVKAHRLLKKPEIVETIVTQQRNIRQQLITPNVTTVVSKPKQIVLPTREQYADIAWKRSSDESKLKDDLKHKYFETTGKVLSYIGREESQSQEKNIVNIICSELNLSLNSEAPAIDISEENISSDISTNMGTDINITEAQNSGDAENKNSPSPHINNTQQTIDLKSNDASAQKSSDA